MRPDDTEGRALRLLAERVVAQDLDEGLGRKRQPIGAEHLATQVVQVDDGDRDLVAEGAGDVLAGLRGLRGRERDVLVVRRQRVRARAVDGGSLAARDEVEPAAAAEELRAAEAIVARRMRGAPTSWNAISMVSGMPSPMPAGVLVTNLLSRRASGRGWISVSLTARPWVQPSAFSDRKTVSPGWMCGPT